MGERDVVKAGAVEVAAGVVGAVTVRVGKTGAAAAEEAVGAAGFGGGPEKIVRLSHSHYIPQRYLTVQPGKMALGGKAFSQRIGYPRLGSSYVFYGLLEG